MAEVIQRGLQEGSIFSSWVKYNPHDVTQAFAKIPGLPADIFVKVQLHSGRRMQAICSQQ